MQSGNPAANSDALHGQHVEFLRMTPEKSLRNDSDPEVQLFPTFGYPIAGGTLWRIQIQGRICHKAPVTFGKRLMLKGLIRALDISPAIASSELFQSRIKGFLHAPITGARMQVSIAGQPFVLRGKSKSSGLFTTKLDLPIQQLSQFKTYGEAPVSSESTDCTHTWDIGFGQVTSPIFLAQSRGLSVISDIDDTIKLTEVNSRRKMLHRTFAEPFEAIDGMARVYQRWASQGALFHYVSSSPWQIYDAVQDFIDKEAFPAGSMHLKWFRLRDEIFKRWRILRRKSKSGVIRSLLRRMPGRAFILVGDSGEKDPEIYAKLAAKYPRQVIRICIRQIDANPIDNERLERIYRRYGMTVPIQVFSNASQLGDLTI